MNGDRTLNSATVETGEQLTASALTSILRETLLPMDIPTPSVLETHVKHLKNFNVARFKPADFVEPVDFDALSIELIRGDGKKRPHRRNPMDEA